MARHWTAGSTYGSRRYLPVRARRLGHPAVGGTPAAVFDGGDGRRPVRGTTLVARNHHRFPLWSFFIELPLVSHCSFASTQLFSLFVFTRRLIAERIAFGVYISQTITTTSKLHADRSIFAVVVIAA